METVEKIRADQVRVGDYLFYSGVVLMITTSPHGYLTFWCQTTIKLRTDKNVAYIERWQDNYFPESEVTIIRKG